MRKIVLATVFFLASLVFLISPSLAADYYVDPSGNDAGGGGPGLSAWKTITHALASVSSGDTIHVAAGTYDTAVNGETFPLAIPAGVYLLADSSGAIISRTNSDGDGSLITMADAATIEGFTINDSEYYDITITVGINAQVLNNAINCIDQSYKTAISLASGTDNVVISGNNISASTSTSYGINFPGTFLTADNVLISNNTIEARTACIRTGNSTTTNALITQNTIIGSSGTSGYGIDLGTGSSGTCTISSNEVRDTDNYAIAMSTISSIDHNVYSNTIINCQKGISCYGRSGTGYYLTNNIISGVATMGYYNVGYIGILDWSDGTINSTNNNFWSIDTPYDGTINATNDSFNYPRFVDGLNNDFRLFDDSLCKTGGEGGTYQGKYGDNYGGNSSIIGESWVDAVAGNDTTGNGSIGTPWKTLTKAVANTTGTINVKAGTYDSSNGESFPLLLSVGQYLKSIASPTTNAVISSAGQNAKSVQVPASATIEGFSLNSNIGNVSLGLVHVVGAGSVLANSLTNSVNSAVGIYVAPSGDSAQILNNTISVTGSSTYGIRLEDVCDSFLVQGNTIEAGSSGYGVGLDYNGGSNFAIKDNTITAHYRGIYLGYKSSAYELSGNIIRSSGGTYGIETDRIYSGTICSNEVVGFTTYGMFLEPYSGYQIDVYNNTLVDNTGIGIHSEDATTNMWNNIIACFDSAGTIGVEQTSGSTTSTYDCVYNYTTDWSGLSAGTGTITASPSFTNAAANDYTLTPASPCIAAGTPEGIDMGAYDYVDVTAPTIDDGALHASNQYVDVTFSEGVYNTNGGSGALETTDFAVTFAANGGSASGASVNMVTDNGGVGLSGGESIIRCWLQITGTPSGVETVEIKPVADSIYDAAGNVALNSETTGTLTLNDLTSPSVTNVTSTADNGYYLTDATLPITVTFNETVNVTGTPTMEIFLISGNKWIPYSGGDGTDTLTFLYTVEAGDSSNGVALKYASNYAVSLNGGTIQDAAGNNANLQLPIMGEAGSLSANKSLIIDTIGPSISIGQLWTDNSYVLVTFSEGVYNTNGAVGALEASDFSLAFAANGGGASDVTIASVKKSDNNPLAAGDTIIRVNLTVTGTPTGDETITITPKDGSSIYDVAGNAASAVTTTGALSMYDQRSPEVALVTSSKDNGSYSTGTLIPITVTFDEIVNVNTGGGTPYVELETGDTDRQASYASGTGGATLTFNYTVQAGDTSSDLDYTGTGALVANGGIISDNGANLATLTLASPGAAGSIAANKAIVIDTTSPTGSGLLLRDLSDGGTTYTNALTVSVEASGIAGSPTDMMMSELADFGGGSWVEYANPTTYSLAAGEDGARTVYYKTRDAALNESDSLSDSIVLDTANPDVPTLVTPADESYTSDTTPTFTWEAVTGAVSYEITINSTPQVATQSATSYTASELTDGSHTWEVRAKDAANNWGEFSSTFNVTVDATVPSVELLTPNGGESLPAIGDPYDITWSASDAIGLASNPIAISYSTDGGDTWTSLTAGTANDGSYEWSLPAVSTSMAKVKITATDLAGNSTTDTGGAFVIDASAPTAVISTSGTGASTLIVVTFTEAMDQSLAESAFAISPVVAGSFSWNDASTIMTFTPTDGFSAGTYSISVATTASDAIGNPLSGRATDTVLITSTGGGDDSGGDADVTAPTISVRRITADGRSPIASNSDISADLNFDVYCYDDVVLDALSILVFVDGVQVSPDLTVGDGTRYVTRECSFSESLAAGTHEISAEVTDGAGHRVTTARTGLRVAGAGDGTAASDIASRFNAVGSGGASASAVGSSSATVAYNLNKDANITFYMYGLSGEMVKTLKMAAGANGAAAGYNQLSISAVSDVSGAEWANGIYVFKLVSDGKVVGKGRIVVYH